MRRSLLVALAVLATLAACADRRPPGPGRDGENGPAMTMVNSPTGEPLGRAVCADALTGWFGRADANGDGGIDRQEFQADSRALFARMDRDGDGFVTPDELQALRMPFVLEQAKAEAAARPERRGPGGGGGGGGPGGAMGGGRPSADQGQRGGDRPTDPVMTADGNLDFKVSAAEFERRTAEEFARLDGDDDHRLGLDEINRDCPSRPAGQPRP